MTSNEAVETVDRPWQVENRYRAVVEVRNGYEWKAR